jgi:hypothetical protein
MRAIPASGLVLAFYLTITTGAVAQTALPPGPYNETCQGMEMKGSTLHAKCQTSDGKWAAAKLNNADKCSDGVINLNGVLSCQAGLLPPGSYVDTCSDVRLEGTTLRANCKNKDTKLTPTELKNANQCKGDIANYGGALKCVPSANPSPTPQDTEKKDKKKKRFVVF